MCPGLAKTLTVATLARALHLKFSRIQFTPDLMPSDITGTEIIEEDHTTGKRSFRFVQGPIFANIVLADEINRTPPKTQAALLQAMQEYQITAGSNTFDLDPPFFVMATQNPIEQEGTYPLPEAQLDRFMLSIHIGYPSREEERRIVNATTQATQEEVRPILSGRDLLWIQQLVREIPASDHMVDYAVDLVRATRPKEPGALDFIKSWLAWGAGPRAAQYIILASKARAILHGRLAVSAGDIRSVVRPVLRHRIFTNFNADAEGVDADQIIDRILKSVPEPSYGEPGAAGRGGRSEVVRSRPSRACATPELARSEVCERLSGKLFVGWALPTNSRKHGGRCPPYKCLSPANRWHKGIRHVRTDRRTCARKSNGMVTFTSRAEPTSYSNLKSTNAFVRHGRLRPCLLEEQKAVLAHAGKQAGWDDPAFDVYNDLDPRRQP